METELPAIGSGPNLHATIYALILHADPVVKAVMALLTLASVVCWTIILEKAIRLRGFGAQVRRFERFVAGNAAAVQGGSWLAEMLIETVSPRHGSGTESRFDLEARLEKAMRLTARFELRRLQPRLRFLATVGSTAPFVGLFGTVWGIMNSFTAIAGQQDTSLAVVAPGIAEALFATALGLATAIPAVIGYNQITGSLSRATERLNHSIALLAQSTAVKIGGR